MRLSSTSQVVSVSSMWVKTDIAVISAKLRSSTGSAGKAAFWNTAKPAGRWRWFHSTEVALKSQLHTRQASD